MEPDEIPVSVVPPEKELEDPSFTPSPVQPIEVSSEAPSGPTLPKKEDAQIPSVEAEAAVTSVLDQFGKLVDDFRATRDVNLNEPLEPYSPGQQIYEQRQQFSEEPDDDLEVVTRPFTLSFLGQKLKIAPGFVRCFYQNNGYIDVVPSGMHVTEGLVTSFFGTFVYLKATCTGSFNVSDIEIVFSNYDLASELPYSYLKIGACDIETRTVFNYINSSVKFDVCGYAGIFTPFIAT